MLFRPKTPFSARFCAYFQIQHSLPDSAKNFAGTESQNHEGTDGSNYHEGQGHNLGHGHFLCLVDKCKVNDRK